MSTFSPGKGAQVRLSVAPPLSLIFPVDSNMGSCHTRRTNSEDVATCPPYLVAYLAWDQEVSCLGLLVPPLRGTP